MLVIREMITKKLYCYCVYEKWWYCFFLFGAWFLPHRCYKVKNLYLKKMTAKEKAKQNMGTLTGIVLGPILLRFLSKEVFYVIGKQYIVFHYLGVYLLLVSLNFIMFFLLKMPPNVDQEEFVDIRFVSIKKKSIKSLLCSVFCISLTTTGALIINDITMESIITFIGAILLSCLMYLGFGVKKECVSSDGKVYRVGIDAENFDD